MTRAHAQVVLKAAIDGGIRPFPWPGAKMVEQSPNNFAVWLPAPERIPNLWFCIGEWDTNFQEIVYAADLCSEFLEVQS